ncbi:MAG: hypothetical protein ABIJ57_09020 [Pseudomonadota bacterium]
MNDRGDISIILGILLAGLFYLTGLAPVIAEREQKKKDPSTIEYQNEQLRQINEKLERIDANK